jgi:hypothetical protein
VINIDRQTMIKNTIIWFLVLNYVLTILSPLTPWFQYWVRYDYIVKNLCVNKDKPESCCKGKCHLKKEIQKQEKEENKQEPKERKETRTQDIHLLTETNIGTMRKKSGDYYTYAGNSDIKQLNFPPDLPPPR